jgi:hypothetical protein
MNAKASLQKLTIATFSVAALAGAAILSSPGSARAEASAPPSTPIKTFECPSDGASGQDLIVDSLLYWRDTAGGNADLGGARQITFTGLE